MTPTQICPDTLSNPSNTLSSNPLHASHMLSYNLGNVLSSLSGSVMAGKTVVIGVRMTPEERVLLERAAAEASVRAGRPLSLSGWMLSVLVDAASGGAVVAPAPVPVPPAPDAFVVPAADKAERLAKARAAQASVKLTEAQMAENRRKILARDKKGRDDS